MQTNESSTKYKKYGYKLMHVKELWPKECSTKINLMTVKPIYLQLGEI